VEKRVERAIEERIVSEAEAAEQEKLNRVAKNGSQLRTLQHMKQHAPDDYAAVLDGAIPLKQAPSYPHVRQMAEKSKGGKGLPSEAKAEICGWFGMMGDAVSRLTLNEINGKFELAFRFHASNLTFEQVAGIASDLMLVEVERLKQERLQYEAEQRVLTGEQVCESS
jgi:hypothetical protein